MITLLGINIKVEFFVLLTFLIALAIQLLLCFKVKFRIVRLIPVGIFAVLTAVNYILALYHSNSWDGLGYMVIAIYTFILLTACGAAWAAWIIIKKIKSRK